jgi:uncharacterized protein (TIGR02145 family)
MKNSIILLYIGFVVFSIILYSCQKKEIPTIETAPINSIAWDGAKSGGIIISDGNADITLLGVVCSDKSNPSLESYVKITNDTQIGINIKAYGSEIVDLKPNTGYYLRAYASNSVGTAYGQEERFTTLENITGIYFNPKLVYDSIKDVEGNVYKTIKIGTQTWMAENLRATKFNDGTSIPEVTILEDWDTLTSAAYCWAGIELSNKNIYGAWYNFYTVEDSMHGNLCPAGWHVPTEAEWNTLLNYLEPSTAADKLKEVGTTHWLGTNYRANNESGFTALPGGERSPQIDTYPGWNDGLWWGSTLSSVVAVTRSRGYVLQINNYSKKFGLSVRCFRDN